MTVLGNAITASDQECFAVLDTKSCLGEVVGVDDQVNHVANITVVVPALYLLVVAVRFHLRFNERRSQGTEEAAFIRIDSYGRHACDHSVRNKK